MKQSSHILYLTNANDAQEYLEQLKAERKAIEQVLSKAIGEKLLSIKNEIDLEFNDLFDVFNDLEYNERIKIFHYAGHSDSESIMLESKNGATKEISIDDFSKFMGFQKGLQLVFLNSCMSENLADKLIERGIPVVIGTTTAIKDGDAALFAKKFYQAIGGGKSIGAAFEQADIYFRNHDDELNGDYRMIKFDDKRTEEMPWLVCSQNDKALEWSILPSEEKMIEPRTHEAKEESIDGDLAMISCNRKKILRRFDLSLKRKEEEGLPSQFFFLKDQPNGEVESILKRLVITLQNDKSNVKPIDFGKIEPQMVEYFPDEQLQDIKYSLRKAFNRVVPRHQQVKSLSELAKNIDEQYPKFQYDYLPFMFRIDLHTNDCWDNIIKPALDWFIRDFTNLDNLKNKPKRRFIFFFIVGKVKQNSNSSKHKDNGWWKDVFSKSKTKAPIQLDVFEVLKEYATNFDSATILPPLQKVDRNDLDLWYNRFEKNASNREKLVDDLIEKIGRRTEVKDIWHMSHVEAELKRIVEERANDKYNI